MSARWRWLRVRAGFTIRHDGRTFTAGDLVRVKASDARAWAASTSPVRPWLPVRVAYALARTARLIAEAAAETRLARRRASVRRRRAAEAVRRRAMVVRMVRK